MRSAEAKALLDINALTDLMVKIYEFASEKRSTVKELDLSLITAFENGKGCSTVDAVLEEYTDCV